VIDSRRERRIANAVGAAIASTHFFQLKSIFEPSAFTAKKHVVSGNSGCLSTVK